jgi:hypothetical protein
VTKEPRDKVVSVRLTVAEYDALTARAERAGENLSDFARDTLFASPQAVWAPPTGSGSLTTSAHKSMIVWHAPVRQDGDTGYLTVGRV